MISHTNNEKADCATNLTAITGFGKDFTDALIFSACILNLAMNDPIDTKLGISKMSLYVAIPIAFWSASGSMYCHRLLNTKYQSIAPEVFPLMIQSPARPISTSIPFCQKMALAGDWYGHIAEVIALVSLGLKLIFGNPQNLSRLGLAGIYFALFLLGAICSFGEFRSCRNIVRESNSRSADSHHMEVV